MAVGAVPYIDPDDPNAGVPPPVPPQPSPAAAVPPPTVLTPLGALPPGTPGLAPGQPAGVPPGAAEGTAPAPGAGGPTAQPAAATPPSTDAGPSAQPTTLPPRPTRPPLTGDPAKDIQSSLAYERALDDWHTQKLEQLTSQQNQLASQAAQKDLALAKEEEQRREAMRQQQEQERAQKQAAIDDSVKQRMAAQGSIENSTWRGDQSTGSKIASVIGMALSGIGQGLSAAGGHPAENMAMKVIDERTAREYDIAKNKLANANESVLQARYGYKDTLDNQRAALNDLDADFSSKHRLIAEEAAAQMKAKGVAPEMIASSELVNGNLQKASQYEDNIHAREIEAGRKNELADSTIAANSAKANANQALAAYRQGRTHKPGTGGGGAGGGSKAIDAMNTVAKAGGSVGDLEEAGVKAGMSRKEALAQAKAMAAGHGKGGGAGGGGDQSLVVRDVDGTPIGMAPSTRNVKQLEDRFVNYDQAIKSLQGLLQEGSLVPRGSKWDNAVLAIASTTTAGATDTNVAHEAGTLKDAIGTVGSQAIQDKIADLQRRQQQFKKTLRPLPTGFKVDQGDAGGAPKKTQQMGGATYEFDGTNWQKVK